MIGTLSIAQRVAADDGQRTVIAPFVGIPDLVLDVRQFVERLLLGVVGHPRQLGDVGLERSLEFMDHLQSGGLALRRKFFGDIRLAQGLSQISVGKLHAAFPAGTKLLGSCKDLSVEGEVFVDKGSWQQRRGMMCRLPAKISLDVFHIAGRHQLVHALHEIGHGYIEAIEAGAGNANEILFPGKSGTQLLKLNGGHLVIDLVGIAPLHSIHRGLRQLALEGQDSLGIGGSLQRRLAQQLEHVGHVLDILVAQFD